MSKNRINIFDVDQTTISGSAEDVFDIAFVPGFTRKYFGDVIREYDPSSMSGALQPGDTHPENGKYWYNKKDQKKFLFKSYQANNYKFNEIGTVYKYIAPNYAFYIDDGSKQTVFLETTTGTSSLYQYEIDNNDVLQVYKRTVTKSQDITTQYVDDTTDLPNFEISGSNVIIRYENGDVETLPTEIDIGQGAKVAVWKGSSGNRWMRVVEYVSEHIIPLAEYSESESITDRGYATVDQETGGEISGETIGTTYLLYKDDRTGSGVSTAYTYTQETWDGLSIDNITRCNSVSEFKNQFGSEPISVWNHTWGGNTKNTRTSVKPPFEFAKEESGKTTNVEIQKWINNNNLQSEIVWVDKGWLYACELLMNGIPVYYHATDITEDKIKDASDVDTTMRNAFFGVTDSTVDNHNFRDIYKQLADKGEYNVKYITTGAFGIDLDIESDTNIVTNIVTINTNADDAEFEYPFYDDEQGMVTRGLVEYLVDIANYRKDCLVLVDGLQDDNELLPDNKNSVYYKLDTRVQENAFVNYNSEDSMTMDDDDKARSGRRGYNTFPWYKAVMLSFPNAWRQYRPVDKNVFIMPGSFAYLTCLATSIQKYESASWEAIAGVTRALVPNFVSLYVNDRLTNAVADAYNKRNATGINAITNIRPYGYCIWGNRTLVNNAHFAKQGDTEDGLVASSFVDIMSMVCNVNKVAYRACKRLMFEKNNEVLWVRFLQAVSPYLDQLVTGGAIANYEIQREESTMRGQLVAKIVIWPVYSVENFDIAIVLRDQETTVES